MKLSAIIESTSRDEAFAGLLRDLQGQVSDSSLEILRTFHSKKRTRSYHTQNVTNQEIYQQLLNGDRLLAILEPHPDPKNKELPPKGIVDCGIELFPSEDGNEYLIGPVAATGYEQLWQEINQLPRAGAARDILTGLSFGYDPVEIRKYVDSEWQQRVRSWVQQQLEPGR